MQPDWVPLASIFVKESGQVVSVACSLPQLTSKRIKKKKSSRKKKEEATNFVDTFHTQVYTSTIG